MDEVTFRRVREHIQSLRRSELQDATLGPVAQRGSTFHRPDELLVDARALPAVADALEGHGGRSAGGLPSDHWRTRSDLPVERDVDSLNGRLEELRLRLVTFEPGNGSRDLQAVVDELRGRLERADGDPDDPGLTPGVQLNHVLFAEAPVYQGGPGGEPFAIPHLSLSERPDVVPTGDPCDIAVLDTGLPVGPDVEPLVGVVFPNLDDFDLLVGADHKLASQAGHGLFVCSLVARAAGGLRIDPGRVLDQRGVGDDASVAAELGETNAPVVNLSLGGYTTDDVPPASLQQAVDRLRVQGRVVVAAAGNNASDRPFFPAALKGVIAVGAYDSAGGGTAPAAFSNFGPWVDVWAPGEGLRGVYVTGTWRAHDGDREFEGSAGWSGTSFAAPLVAAEIARRLAREPAERRRTAQQVAYELLGQLGRAERAGSGLLFVPERDLTQA